MRERDRSIKHRSRAADAGMREINGRAHIAQIAARLILEHGLSDWTLAKRKAARQLMLPERTALPGDDEVEAALFEHQALFGGPEHEAMLRAKRELALTWMERLAPFSPMLIGGVAAGWAGEHNDVRLELTAEASKAVEILLVDRGVRYRVDAGSDEEEAAEYRIETPRGDVRLVVRTPNDVRHRPRRDRHGRAPVRLNAAELGTLLDTSS